MFILLVACLLFRFTQYVRFRCHNTLSCRAFRKTQLDYLDEILAFVVSRLSYDKIKDVKVKKAAMSNDYMLQLRAGFLRTAQIVFDGRSVEDVKKLIRTTPLA